LAVVGSRIEAELIVGMLHSHGLRAALVADDAGGMRPHLQMQGVRVLVHPSDEASARRLLAAADNTAGPIDVDAVAVQQRSTATGRVERDLSHTRSRTSDLAPDRRRPDCRSLGVKPARPWEPLHHERRNSRHEGVPGRWNRRRGGHSDVRLHSDQPDHPDLLNGGHRAVHVFVCAPA
jgi:hypothetical protein